MHERLRRAVRDVVVLVAVCCTPVAALLLLHDGLDDRDFERESLPHAVMAPLRHGLSPTVASAASGDVPVDGLGCIALPGMVETGAPETELDRQRAREQEQEVVVLIEQLLEGGVRAVLLDPVFARYWDYEDPAHEVLVVDEQSPIRQLLAEEPRVATVDAMIPLAFADGAPQRWPEDQLERVPEVAPWQPVTMQPRPPGALAPVDTSYSVVERDLHWSALVVRLPDGELRPTRMLAVWMLSTGERGAITVEDDAVTVGSTRFAATNGWIPVAPPGPQWPLEPEVYSPYRCAESFHVSGDFLHSDRGGTLAVGDLELDLDLVHITQDFDFLPEGTDRILETELAMVSTGERARTSSRPLTFLLTLLAASAVAFVGRTESWWAGLATLALAVGGVWALAVGTYDLGPTFDLLPILLATIPAYLLAVWLRGRASRRHTDRLEALVTTYVPREVTGDLVGNRGGDPLVTGEREATVVFCDLRNFTPVASDLAPADVQRLLEVFYRHVGQRVRAAGGTLVQYIGDEVFASFGPPAVVDDHADRALACARALRDDAEEFVADLEAEGFEPIRYGVGLHTGWIVTAEVGGEQHRQYTVIGDAVNVGSRLTTAAGPGEVLFSGELLARVRERPESEQLLQVQLKGIERPLEVYRLS